MRVTMLMGLLPLAALAAEPQAFKELTFHNAPAPLAKDAVTSDWTNFLGPNHAPVSPETKLKADLTKLPVVFEVAKGTGYSAPAILGERLVLFHRVGNEEVVECLHRETGRRNWRVAYPTAYEDRYGYTNGPRCSPVIDKASDFVFTFGAEGKLHAIDLASGDVKWKRDILAEYKLEQNFFGVGSTPLIEGENLVVNVGAKDACVVAFDLKMGKPQWAATAPNDWGPSYASPIPATVKGLRRVFVFAGGESRPATGGLLCIDPKSGAVDFTFAWRGKRFESVNASAPLIFDDKVYIAECYGKGGVMLQMSAATGKLSAKELWSNQALSTHFTTALLKDGHLYGCDGHGPNNCPLVCLDAATGEEKWRSEPDLSETITLRTGEKRQIALNTDRCHLIHADGKTLCFTEWGHLLWLDLSAAGVKVRSRTWLFFSRENWSVPVISKGLLYICQNTPDELNGTARRLLCYDLRGKE